MSEEELLRPVLNPGRPRALRESLLLATPAAQTFDRLTRPAVRLVGVPVAIVPRVDEGGEFHQGEGGFGEPLGAVRGLQGTTFRHSAIAQHCPLITPDPRGARAEPGAEALRSEGGCA